MENKNWKLFTFIGVGSLIVGGATAGVVFALTLDEKEEFITGNVGPVREFPFEYRDANDHVVNSIPGLKIKQYKTRKIDGSYDYFFNKDELNEFVKRFFEKGMFGPEIFKLKSITFSNVDVSGGESLGLYFPGTQELNIYPSNHWKMLAASGKENNTDYKIELMSQVFYHEYGHHMAYSYMNNPFPGKNNIDNSTYVSLYDAQGNVKRAPSFWNANFLNTFKHEFAYDRPTTKYPTVQGTYQSLGSKYDAQQLFNTANQQDNSMSVIKNVKSLVFAATIDKPGVISNPDGGITKENLSYLYSISEQYTRKLFLSTYRINDTFGNIAHEKYIYSPFQEEQHLFETPVRGHGIPMPGPNNVVDFVRYLQDAPFPTVGNQKWKPSEIVDHTNTTRNFTHAILEQFGQTTGADISFMFPKNVWHATEHGKLNAPYATTEEITRAGEMIKFGGYISSAEAQKYTHVGYMTLDAHNKQVFHPFEIIKRNLHFGYKRSIYDSTWQTPTGETSFYMLKDWVKGDDIKDRTLYFAEDANGKNAVKMTSIRSSDNTDYASSINWAFPSNNKNSRVFKAIQDHSGDVKIAYAGIHQGGN